VWREKIRELNFCCYVERGQCFALVWPQQAIVIDKIAYWHLKSNAYMGTLSQQLRLFLIIAMVLSPVQHLFAMQLATQSDSPTLISAENTASVSNVSRRAPTDTLKIFDNDCSKHGKSGSCKSAKQCGSCPLTVEISQASPKRAVLNVFIQPDFTNTSLNSTDLLPDYRPPRNS